MPNNGCDREQDLLTALSTGQWDGELRAHVAACATCADLFEVASALIEDRAQVIRHSEVRGSGLAWWRIKMRERQEAAIAARRALTGVQAVALTCAVPIAALVFNRSIDLSSLAAVAPWTIPLLVALVVWSTLAPVAVYFAVNEE